MKTEQTVRRLGHTFRRMAGRDFDAFAGAEEGSWMASTDDVVLIADPNFTEITEITLEGDETRFVLN